jgi:hypothetical protein
VLLGRVTSGQLAVTLVDLDRRGHLRIDEIHGVPPDWSLTRTNGDDALLPYEQALLGGVCTDHERRLSELGARLGPTLKRARARLLRDAARRGDLRRWRRRRTESGDRLVPVITAYRRELRRLRGVRGEAALDPYLPYALLFGIGPDATRSARSRTDRHRLADFAAAWVATCARITGWAAEPAAPDEADTWSHNRFGGGPL